MKNIYKIALAVTSIAVSFTSLAASDLLVTSSLSMANNNKVISGSEQYLDFEFLNENNATSMQFIVDLNGVPEKSVNFKGCVSKLPKTHQGGCNIVDGKLKVIVFSLTNTVIPTGAIGSISFNLGEKSLNKVAGITVKDMILAAPNREKIKGSTLLDHSSINKILK